MAEIFDSEILCNIIRNHVAEHGFYRDIDSLSRGQGVRDILDIHYAMIMSSVELLEKKDYQRRENGDK